MNHLLAKFKHWIESDWVSATTTTISNQLSPQVGWASVMTMTEFHLVSLKQGGACSVFPKRFPQKILTPGWRLWWPYQNWQGWGQVRVEATRGLPKLNFHEELGVSSSVCRMGPRSLVLMKVKVILCTLYLSSCYIFSSWKGRFGESTRQICFANTSENKGWQRNLGSWSWTQQPTTRF